MKNTFLIALAIFITGLYGCGSGRQEPGKDQENTSAVKEKQATVIDKGNGLYEIVNGNLKMEVDAGYGGRITSLKTGQKEVLSLQDNHPENWGSVFWTSPQEQWGWPPSKTFDSLPYKVFHDSAKLVMKSLIDTALGYQLKKSFSVNNADSSFHMRYTIYNRNDSTQKAAPWEVTRVPAKGLVFFPKGEDSVQSPFPVTDTMGTIWFPYDTASVQEGHDKLIADGSEGWLAYASEGHLFIKSFENISPEEAAPGEGEIEIYAHPEYKYMELEPQGAYRELPAGDSLVWNVKWHLKALPPNLSSPEPGNKKLLKMVRNVVKDKG